MRRDNDILPDGGRRLTGLRAAGVTLAVLGLLAGAATIASAVATPTPAAAPVSIPGTDPQVQRWLERRGDAQVELANALLAVQHLTGPSPTAASACRRLDRAARTLREWPPAPLPDLGAAASAGLEQLSGAAASCRAGDFPAMRRQLGSAVALRATAQAEIDEILDGDAHGHH